MFRQTIGIPMGTNAGPVLANLYLYRYESTFISRVRAVISLEAARLFRHTFRLIDDVLSLDHPEFKGYVDSVAPDDLTGEEVGGIYPQQLRIVCTKISSPKNAQFLGMDVKDEGARILGPRLYVPDILRE